MKVIFNPYNGQFQYVDSDTSSKFITIQTDEGTYPVAESATDILTLQSSDGSIVVEGDQITDTIDIKVLNEWTDNKQINKVIIPLTQTFLETNGTAIAHNITGLDTLVSAVAIFNADGIRFILPYILSGGILITFKVDATNITSIVAGSPEFENFINGHFILEYTTV
jgi:hypothetical protein